MNIKKECLKCLQNQSKQAIKLTSYTSRVAEQTNQAIESLLHSFQDFQVPPPQVAIEVYESIASKTNNPDIYSSIKTACIQKARQITNHLIENKPFFSDFLSELQWAIRVAALGNIIDYGSATKFDIYNQDFDLSHLDFVIFDFEPFVCKIQNAKKLLYIGDNAGENIFDEILIETIKSLYPDLEIIYFVRGNPIINDITLKDLHSHKECHKIFQLCEVVDSGVKSPGFIYKLAKQNAQNIFNQADLILAKGMGNFECLESMKDDRIFLLFKIKCQVIADYLKLPLGKMIFTQR